MKVSELIKNLQLMPQDQTVVIFDNRKSLHYSSCETTPSAMGIEANFDITNEEGKNHGTKWSFVALSFDNDDYTEDGDLLTH